MKINQAKKKEKEFQRIPLKRNHLTEKEMKKNIDFRKIIFTLCFKKRRRRRNALARCFDIIFFCYFLGYIQINLMITGSKSHLNGKICYKLHMYIGQMNPARSIEG